MIGIILFILTINIIADEAGVIKILDNRNNLIESTTASFDNIMTTIEPEQPTIKNQDNAITPRRDGESTILIVDQPLLYSASDELFKTESQTMDLKKSGNLLLLSTAKIAEKPKEPEENLDESGEDTEMLENVTQIDIENTTVITNEDTTPNLSIAGEVTGNITKLYPIKNTIYTDDNKRRGNKRKGSRLAIDEFQPKESLNLNNSSVALEEPDVLLGSYADVNSELHLQPIVQSIEIVPYNVDDASFIHYVQPY